MLGVCPGLTRHPRSEWYGLAFTAIAARQVDASHTRVLRHAKILNSYQMSSDHLRTDNWHRPISMLISADYTIVKYNF